jgi:hypothetical protein
MKLKNIIKVGVATIVAVTGFSSCSDFLTIYPTDKTIGEDFWKSKEDVQEMVAGAYSSMCSYDCQTRAIIWGAFRSDELVKYLQLQGLNAELRNKENARLTAFRSNVHFPELLFDLQLTGHREERFLMKIEAQDQGVDYTREMAIVQRNGFSFPVPVPPLSVLLSMKLSALLTRQKGRDFYDAIFLMQRTEPDYAFLQQQKGIANKEQLETALRNTIAKTEMKMQQRDFEHLLFDSHKSETILRFIEMI